jgi:hypothetical protein
VRLVEKIIFAFYYVLDDELLVYEFWGGVNDLLLKVECFSEGGGFGLCFFRSFFLIKVTFHSFEFIICSNSLTFVTVTISITIKFIIILKWSIKRVLF